MKLLLKLWFRGRKSFLSAIALGILSEELIKLGKYIPKEFNRKTQSLSDIGRWKATVLRFFLLYAGPLVLKDQIPNENLHHFYILNCAIRILCHTSYYKTNNENAENMLRFFVEDFKSIYGERYITFNVHNLIHLAKECLNNDGPLDEFSAFEFENAMQFIKKVIKKPEKPLQQLHRRISEGYRPKKKIKVLPMYSQYELKDEIPQKKRLYNLSKAFKKICFSNYELSTNVPDNCCILKNKNIIQISAIGVKNNKTVIKGKIFKKTSSLPDYAIHDSRDIDIFVADLLSDSEEFYDVDEIQNKACLFFYKNIYYAVGLLHH